MQRVCGPPARARYGWPPPLLLPLLAPAAARAVMPRCYTLPVLMQPRASPLSAPAVCDPNAPSHAVCLLCLPSMPMPDAATVQFGCEGVGRHRFVRLGKSDRAPRRDGGASRRWTAPWALSYSAIGPILPQVQRVFCSRTPLSSLRYTAPSSPMDTSVITHSPSLSLTSIPRSKMWLRTR